MTTDKKEVIAKLLAKVQARRPIIGATAGSGLCAGALERGGADFIVFYNSARYRQAGVKGAGLAGLLPFADANGLILHMAGEITGAVKEVLAVAGVYAADPLRNIKSYLRELKETGVAGIQNWPSVGLIDGRFREQLEKSGYGYDQEVKLIALANESGLFTCPYAFNPREAAAMAEAGADVIVAHLGLTLKTPQGQRDSLLQEAILRLRELCTAAREKKQEVVILVHGGPFATPDDVSYAYANVTEVAGYFGASILEGLPAEEAVSAAVKQFLTIN